MTRGPSAFQRPRVLPVARPADRWLEVASVVALIAIVTGAVAAYSGLPDRVPTHFDLAGRPDDYGSRATVFFMPVVAAVLYTIMTLAQRLKPWYWNIPARVTEENAAAVYGATARMLRIVKLASVLLVGLVLVVIVRSAHAGNAQGTWLPLIGVGALLMTVFGCIVGVRRAARTGEAALTPR